MIRRFSIALFLCSVVSTGVSAQDVLDNVNLFIGTANDYGQMTPGACMPYSQVQVCPDSKPRQHPGYDYEVTQISGFSVNRLSGVGGSGCGGNVSLMPDETGADVHLIKSTEQASPGYYSVQLSNGVWFTATANRRMAVERFSFPSAQKAVLLLDPGTAFDKVYKASFCKTGGNVGQGYIDCANTCRRGNYHLYYRLYTSEPFEMQELDGGKKKLTFPNLSARYLEVRIVLSTGLEKELDAMKESDVWRTDFLTMVEQAQRQWRQLLSTVKVEGGTADQRTIFYTSLYRTFHSPFAVTDRNMKHYLGTDGKEYEAKDFSVYQRFVPNMP